MAKYFSSQNNGKIGYSYTDLVIYILGLKDSDIVFNSQEFKTTIRNVAILLADKSRPAYLDMSMLVNKTKDGWNYGLFTASDFLKKINKDINTFIQERALENEEREFNF